ncbi:uncharacterized protein LOC110662811 [Hevea brasiliensis]|uniref:uncharacterized protein LOC110662811 n=1 Tax=Hevea brasiliensis TaxID=3981 RepID=UPI0025DC4D5A|nr:uncharacterized protein LOC110662811 [Hevea brasiliensis]XP_057997038.1 uncharacterized protein LOC110662811 [Hevea brasiliensis]XP_057997039.1 uncharacterized protein LOC110662811 [Hevea brasiliensis]
MLVDVIQLEYPNPTNKRTTLVLFKCDWFDPTLDRGWKVHNRYGLIDINHKKRFLSYAYEPFVLAAQSQQVYFLEYPSKKKERVDWWAVCKVKARSRIDCPNVPYQENDCYIASVPIITDDLESLCHENGKVEEHEIEEEIPENEGADEIDRHENEEELDESDFDSSGDEEDEQSDDNIEYNDSEDDEDFQVK